MRSRPRPKEHGGSLAVALATSLVAAATACSSAGAPSGGGAGGTCAGEVDGAGPDSDAPGVSAVESFCRSLQEITCQRAFACIPPDKRDATFIANLGTTLDECLGCVATSCATAATKCPSYDASYGASCLTLFTQASCADLLFGDGLIPPGDCLSACP